MVNLRPKHEQIWSSLKRTLVIKLERHRTCLIMISSFVEPKQVREIQRKMYDLEWELLEQRSQTHGPPDVFVRPATSLILLQLLLKLLFFVV